MFLGLGKDPLNPIHCQLTGVSASLHSTADLQNEIRVLQSRNMELSATIEDLR